MTPVGRIVLNRDVTSLMRRDMFSLMTQYYDDVGREEFERDLSEKLWILELTDSQTGRLCGFSTQMLFPAAVGERTVFALFSGDTIVDEPYRRRNPLAGLWGRLALGLMERFPPGDLYWFLISKGYKTYRFLPLFFREFHPRFDKPTPRELSDATAAFARWKCGESYNDERGVVVAKPGSCRLSANTAAITPTRLRDPHVRFFCKQNPGHAAGDELCCLAPLTPDNFTPAAWKVIRSVPDPSIDLFAIDEPYAYAFRRGSFAG